MRRKITPKPFKKVKTYSLRYHRHRMRHPLRSTTKMQTRRKKYSPTYTSNGATPTSRLRNTPMPWTITKERWKLAETIRKFPWRWLARLSYTFKETSNAKKSKRRDRKTTTKTRYRLYLAREWNNLRTEGRLARAFNDCFCKCTTFFYRDQYYQY